MTRIIFFYVVDYETTIIVTFTRSAIDLRHICDTMWSGHFD